MKVQWKYDNELDATIHKWVEPGENDIVQSMDFKMKHEKDMSKNEKLKMSHKVIG